MKRTLTIPEMIDRNNREIRRDNLNQMMGNLLAMVCTGCTVALMAALLANIIFQRMF